MSALQHLYHLQLTVSCSNGTEREGTFVDVATFTPSPTGISEGESFQLLVDGVRAGTHHPVRKWRRMGQENIGYSNPEDATADALDVSRILTERLATDALVPDMVGLLFLGPQQWRQATLPLAHAVWFSVAVWRQQQSGGDDLLVRI